MISVVIPCYKSNDSLTMLVDSLGNIFSHINSDYEIILVNDCSPDDTWCRIVRLVDSNPFVKGINLMKNVGQHSAILAGMCYAKGDYVLSCDDDGQTPIEHIPEMYQKIKEGYDVVSAKYIDFENKRLWRRFGTAFYKASLRFFLNMPADLELRVFMIIKRNVVNEIIKYDQPYAAINGLVLRTTHNIYNIEMSQHARVQGKSGYTIRKLMRTWADGFTAFSIVPLKLSAVVGGISAFLGILYSIFIVIQKIVNPKIQAGWSSNMALMLFMFGLTLCSLGIIGEYLGRIYMCINKTPAFTVKEVKCNEKE